MLVRAGSVSDGFFSVAHASGSDGFTCRTGSVMPFEKVETQVDFPAQERAVLAFWDQIGAFEKLRRKNRGGPRWSFLDGPITANNPMGVHHAWGRTYKDAFQRYHAMNGQELRYQNGFDCQGLWVEVEVEKELKLQVQARHRKPRARRRVRQHRPLRPGVQGPRRQVRPHADGAVDPPGLLDGLGPRRGLGQSRRTSGAATSPCRRRTTTPSGAF